MVNKTVRNAVLGCNLKNDRMISTHFQGKQFNITVIQVYAPTSNAEEAEVEWLYEDIQDFLELTPKKEVLFCFRVFSHVIHSMENSLHLPPHLCTRLCPSCCWKRVFAMISMFS